MPNHGEDPLCINSIQAPIFAPRFHSRVYGAHFGWQD
jgi:hypothetical protein